MANDSTATATRSGSIGQRVKHGVQSKVLVPIAATVVTAAVSYLIKKLPMILEDKVLPKLKESGAPDKVTNVVEQASSAVGNSSESDGGGNDKNESEEEEQGRAAPSAKEPEVSALSPDEREEQRQEREARRRERKSATQRAA
jgi:hypothetical protein